MILIPFEHPKKILNLQKFQGYSSKIEPAMPFLILKFKRAWQAQFLCHNLETLENKVFLIDLQMMLLSFFNIPYQKSVICEKLIFSFCSTPN